MSWIQITLESEKNNAAEIESAMLESGAYSVTLLDAKDQPVLEPGVGETPLWDKIRVVALYPDTVDSDAVVAQIHDELDLPEVPVVKVENLPDQDWERTWLDDFKPMCFADKFWVYPSTETPADNQLSMILDPGLAFGTGTHPTTALCLEYLAEHDLSGQTVIDYGCGSGILAIAALKMGATKVLAVDNDPQALQATVDNAERNQIDMKKLEVMAPADVPNIRVDTLVANILAGPLEDLAEHFFYLLKHNGLIALSGILGNQAEHLLTHYEKWFRMEHAVEQGDWVRLNGRKDDA